MYLKINGKRYRFKPNKNLLYIVAALVLVIVLVCSLRSCNKYNEEIRGAEYEDVLAEYPKYQVRPCVAPDGTPTSDYFTIYPPEEGDKVIYLTFDDGPTGITPQVLDVLKEQKVPATFFVLGSQAEKNPELIKRIAQEGHAIANHSYSHKFDALYSDADAFISEVNKTRDIIVDLVGESKYAGVFRFPGGAFRDERADFKEKLLQNDIPYVNWNCITGDSETKNPVSSDLYNKAVRTANDVDRDSLVLLMHDTKQASADALPAIIKYFKDNGYRFDVIKRK